VFTKTKHGANRLAQQLERDGIDSDAIHGNKSQSARTRALKRFKDNELQVLVATDIAARGIDIDALPHVVNFDLPNVPEDYVHRIGRTGRAGASGEAVSLVSAEDRPLLAAIERLIGRRIEQQVVEGFELGQRHHAPVAQDSRPRQGQQPRRQHGNEPGGRDSRRHRGQRQQPGQQRGEAPAARDSGAKRGQRQRGEQRDPQAGQSANKRRHRQGQPGHRRHEPSFEHRGTVSDQPQAAHAAADPAPRPSAARQLLSLFGSFARKST